MAEIYGKDKAELKVSITKTEELKFTKQQIQDELNGCRMERESLNIAFARLDEKEALWKEREKQFQGLVEGK